MTGKELKCALQLVQSTARIQFSKEVENEVMMRLARILDILRPKAWGNKSFDEEIALIGNDELMPDTVAALVNEIETIRQQQSPFVSGVTA
jgi:hypothetical protein